MGKRKTSKRESRKNKFIREIAEEKENLQAIDEKKDPLIFPLCLGAIPLVSIGCFLLTAKGNSWLSWLIALVFFLVWVLFGIFIGRLLNKKTSNQMANEKTSLPETTKDENGDSSK